MKSACTVIYRSMPLFKQYETYPFGTHIAGLRSLSWQARLDSLQSGNIQTVAKVFFNSIPLNWATRSDP